MRPSAQRPTPSAASTTSSTPRRSDRSCALVDTDAETWGRVFATNVTGAALATAAAIPHLTESAGKVVYLSSDAGTYGPPWPGLGAYGVSKAALERLIEAWRAEHPDIGFTNLIVGECAGGDGDSATGFSTGWDRELAMRVSTRSGCRAAACPAS